MAPLGQTSGITGNGSGSHVIETVVVQPTPFCNINCSYCYLPQRNVTTVMAQDTIVTLVYEALRLRANATERDGNLARRRTVGRAGGLLRGPHSKPSKPSA